jgi:hypothetical protein
MPNKIIVKLNGDTPVLVKLTNKAKDYIKMASPSYWNANTEYYITTLFGLMDEFGPHIYQQLFKDNCIHFYYENLELSDLTDNDIKSFQEKIR